MIAERYYPLTSTPTRYPVGNINQVKNHEMSPGPIVVELGGAQGPVTLLPGIAFRLNPVDVWENIALSAPADGDYLIQTAQPGDVLETATSSQNGSLNPPGGSPVSNVVPWSYTPSPFGITPAGTWGSASIPTLTGSGWVVTGVVVSINPALAGPVRWEIHNSMKNPADAPQGFYINPGDTLFIPVDVYADSATPPIAPNLYLNIYNPLGVALASQDVVWNVSVGDQP